MRTRAAAPALAALLAAAAPGAACDAPAAAMAGSVVTAAAAEGGPTIAWFEDPTTRYAHGVLGDAIEAGTLAARLAGDPACRTLRVVLPETEVFEDLAPRLADLDGDGRPEILVVQSHRDRGARLAVYGIAPDGAGLRLYAATPNIGRANRWLAPVGAADLDGDGAVEIAYVDRPHLARALRVWRYLPGGLAGQGLLAEIAARPGLTNHRIGEAFITGGIAACADGPRIVTADAGWTRVIATRLTASGTLETEDLGPFGPGAVAAALACAPG